jgi:hypothetical protein
MEQLKKVHLIEKVSLLPTSDLKVMEEMFRVVMKIRISHFSGIMGLNGVRIQANPVAKQSPTTDLLTPYLFES